MELVTIPDATSAQRGALPQAQVEEHPSTPTIPNLNSLALSPPALRRRAYEIFKRGFDLIGGTILFAIHLPAMLVIAALIKVSSPGPIFFVQKRLTLGGRVFDMYKFRSMRTDAEAAGAQWASTDDPRVTKLGKILRGYRLDELPQFINVVIGDMSLVGPRPERPEFADSLCEQLPRFPERLQVRAGITGLAQVSSEYAADFCSYKRKLALDVIYVRNRSLALDAMILFRTIYVMLTRFGAQ